MLNIKLNKESQQPLYVQIRDAIKSAIGQKKLQPGERLPTVKSFSKELGVTQSTILRAYEDLTAAKMVVSYVGEGTYVIDPQEADNQRNPVYPFIRSPLEPVNPEFALAARRLRMGIASSLEALQVLVNKPDIISFTAGVPDPTIAEPDILKRCTNLALKRDQKIYQQYAAPLGMQELREAIALKYNQKGLSLSRDNVLITNGSQQAIAILAQAALENQQRIICESPCYRGVTRAFGAIGHWVESLTRDQDGPLPGKYQMDYTGGQHAPVGGTSGRLFQYSPLSPGY